MITTPIIAASAVGILLAVTGLTCLRCCTILLELMAALTIPTRPLRSASRWPHPRIVRHDHPAVGRRRPLRALQERGDAGAGSTCLARFCFHLDGDQVMLVTVLAALPAAQNINTYAAVYRRGEGLARDATLLSTVLSVPVIVGVVVGFGLLLNSLARLRRKL